MYLFISDSFTPIGALLKAFFFFATYEGKKSLFAVVIAGLYIYTCIRLCVSIKSYKTTCKQKGCLNPLKTVKEINNKVIDS